MSSSEERDPLLTFKNIPSGYHNPIKRFRDWSVSQILCLVFGKDNLETWKNKDISQNSVLQKVFCEICCLLSVIVLLRVLWFAGCWFHCSQKSLTTGSIWHIAMGSALPKDDDGGPYPVQTRADQRGVPQCKTGGAGSAYDNWPLQGHLSSSLRSFQLQPRRGSSSSPGHPARYWLPHKSESTRQISLSVLM